MGYAKATYRDEAVTFTGPILIPAAGGRAEGEVVFLEGRVRKYQPITRLKSKEEPTEKNAAVARLLTLSRAKKVDYSLARDFRTLVQDVYGKELADAISKQSFDNPRRWLRDWLPALFNQKLARVVMWWPSATAVPRPALFCPDREAALFIRLLLNKVTVCLGCGIAFTPRRQDQLFHDLYCANRHRKRRERAKP
jgi:hypothetical protein